jgi:hypothetical protein
MTLPTCKQYSEFLDLVTEKLKIDRNAARSLYGKFTVDQWTELLKHI